MRRAVSLKVTTLPQSKMKYIRDALLEVPDGGWLLWLDADLVVLRHDMDLEALVAGALADVGDAEVDLIAALEFSSAVEDLDRAKAEVPREARGLPQRGLHCSL
jgi:hypothetical protein